MYTLICGFDPVTGWRVHRCRAGPDRHIRVVRYGGQPMLSIPSLEPVQPGWFCNPKTLAVNYVREFPLFTPLYKEIEMHVETNVSMFPRSSHSNKLLTEAQIQTVYKVLNSLMVIDQLPQQATLKFEPHLIVELRRIHLSHDWQLKVTAGIRSQTWSSLAQFRSRHPEPV